MAKKKKAAKKKVSQKKKTVKSSKKKVLTKKSPKKQVVVKQTAIVEHFDMILLVLALLAITLSTYFIVIFCEPFPRNSLGTFKASEISQKIKKIPISEIEDINEQIIDKTKLNITVLNGTIRKGGAGIIAKTLNTKGYNITDVGNAPNFNYTNSIVYYKTGMQEQAQLFIADLNNCAIIAKEDLTQTKDLILHIGTNTFSCLEN